MAIPMLGAKMRPLIAAYRDAWRSAGHPGHGRVMLAFHMFCHENGDQARSTARGPVNHYLKSLIEAASGWETFDSVFASGGAWVGTPQEILQQAREYHELIGGFEVASLQVNFAVLPFQEAERSLDLFGREVLPRLE